MTTTTDTDAFLTEIWSEALTELPALMKRYASEAKTRDDVVERSGTTEAFSRGFGGAAPNGNDVGLALARFEALKESNDVVSDVSAALRSEAMPIANALVSALVLARCFAEEHAWTVCRWLYEFRDIFPSEALPRLHALHKHAGDRATLARSKKKTQNDARGWDELAVAVAGCLAELGDTTLAEGLLPAQPQLAITLLRKGIGVDEAVLQLEKLDLVSGAPRVAVALMEALAEAQVKRAVPGILRFIRSGVFMHAFAALAKLRDERAAEAAHAFLRETCGDAWNVEIIRLAAEHVLRALGEKLPLERARAAIHWPVVDYRTNHPEATTLRAIAVLDLASHGDAKDKELAQKQIQSPYRIVREAARKAFERPPILVSWDPGRVAWTMKNKEGAKTLLAALQDPCAIHRHHIIKALAEDAKSRDAIAAFILENIEERMAMPSYDRKITLDADIDVYLKVGKALASGPSKKIFAESKNPWVRVKMLGVDEQEVECRSVAMKPDPVGPKQRASAVRFDAPPYAFTRGIAKLALADDAERMLVIGPESFVFDPQESTRRLSLGDGSDVTACAISKAGSRFALARGSKIGIHDGESGEIAHRLEVPGEVTALAFSPDGSQIACGTNGAILRVLDVANGKELFAGKAPGEVRGAGWLSPKRTVFLADGAGKAKKSVLVDVDVSKNKSAEVIVPLSSKMATWGKVLATSGDKRATIHDAKLAPKMEVRTDEAVIDLAIESEKSLVLQLERSLQRVKLGGKEPKLEPISRSPVSGLAASGKRIYAPVGYTMTRYHEDANGKVAEGIHFEHVCSIAVLPDGTLVTNGWEGRVLLWKPEGGIAETLFDRKKRIDHLSLSPKKDRIYFGDGHTLRCIDLSSRVMTCIVGGDDVEADIAKHMPEVTAIATSTTHAAWVARDGVHIVDLGTTTEVAHLAIRSVEALAVDDGGRFYASTDHGEIHCIDSSGTVLWARVEHGVDMLEGKLYGNPHRSVAYLATHGSLLASVASDHTVRLFDGPSGERKLRCMRHVGIFNAVAFSPSAKLFAFTYGNNVEVREVDGGVLVARTDDWGPMMQCQTMGVAFTDERTLVVGMDSGALFRVTID